MGGAILLGDKQLWGYLYRDWDLSRELKIKVAGGRAIAYTSFEK